VGADNPVTVAELGIGAGRDLHAARAQLGQDGQPA
jgi:hypothetical protein